MALVRRRHPKRSRTDRPLPGRRPASPIAGRQDMTASSTEARCYRPRRDCLTVGVSGLVFFSAMGIGSAAMFLYAPDVPPANRVPGAAILGLFWSTWAGLSVWAILIYYCRRLRLEEQAIVYHGVVQTKIIKFSEVTRLKWRLAPTPGRVVIRTPNSALTLSLDDFTVEDRLEIIAFVRQSVSFDCQEGWARFEEQTRKWTSPPRPLSRGVLAFAVVGLLLCVGVVLVSGWLLGFGECNVVAGLALVAIVAWPVWQLSKDRTRPGDGSDVT
jgi:hypothetical protein